MKNFEYEKYIEKDIYKIIDKEIEKLDKKINNKVQYKVHKMKEEEIKKGGRGRSRQHTQFEEEDAYDDHDDAYENYSKMTRLRREGLIFTMLYGTSFRFSSYRSSKLQKLNATRLNVSGASKYSERFGRIGIASTCTAIMVIWLTILDSLDDNISSFIAPSTIVFIVSYTIGYIFTLLLEVTVSTLLYCVMIDENKWNKKFKINQGRIKQNVAKLGGGLSAMLAEHLLIMQLKDREVNNKINKMNKFIEKIGKENNLSKIKISESKEKLRNAKKTALATERALLNSIDGPMKLTEYLINVILVENYFNFKYKDQKKLQERARRKYADDIFQNSKYERVKKSTMKKKVIEANKVKNFLTYFPVGEADKLEKAWKSKIERVVKKLKKKELQFKMTGAKQKGIERAFYKSFYSYHNISDGYRCLTDVLRCSFVFNDFNILYKCFSKLIINMKDEFEILRVKDRFNSESEPCGYRDLMINVFCKPKKENEKSIEGIICEIQLHHNIFYKAKKVSHKMYKRTRLFQNGNINEAYDYAKKYVRLVGRFKIYPVNEDTQMI